MDGLVFDALLELGIGNLRRTRPCVSLSRVLVQN